jgi:hypothetical protein
MGIGDVLVDRERSRSECEVYAYNIKHATKRDTRPNDAHALSKHIIDAKYALITWTGEFSVL